MTIIRYALHESRHHQTNFSTFTRHMRQFCEESNVELSPIASFLLSCAEITKSNIIILSHFPSSDFKKSIPVPRIMKLTLSAIIKNWETPYQRAATDIKYLYTQEPHQHFSKIDHCILPYNSQKINRQSREVVLVHQKIKGWLGL